MRRGTPSAILFGQCLKLIRTRTSNKSMRQVGLVIGAKAAAVSQIEQATRALKEPKLSIWAEALGVDEYQLTRLWWATQGYMPNLDGEGWYFCEDSEVLEDHIHYCMVGLLPVYYNKELEIPTIRVDTPIVRRRRKSVEDMSLVEKIKSLHALEKQQVVGYIDALLSQREE